MKPVVCIASGPSVTQGYDLELLRKSRHLVDICCVNDAYTLVNDCDYVFAADRKWWLNHICRVHHETRQRAKLYTLDKHNPYPDRINSCTFTKNLSDCDKQDTIYHGSNSGQMAIDLMRLKGYKYIILLGYDYKVSDKVHFFGDHPKWLLNASNITQWLEHMELYAPWLESKVERLVNCSRDTAINNIKRETFENELRNIISLP